MSPSTAPLWNQIVDDAAIFPPGNAALPDAVDAYEKRSGEWPTGLVGSLVVRDTDLPQLRDFTAPISVVVTGGAGQVAGPLQLAQRLGLSIKGIEVALRDESDLPANARRVVAALDAARDAAGEDLQIFIELPAAPPSAGWLAAADEIAAAELFLKFRTGGAAPDDIPDSATLAHWIDASLDRETPFKCTAGLHRAVRHADPGHHGFLNILLATGALWDGADRSAVIEILEQTDATSLASKVSDDSARARRWFTSFGSCSVDEPAGDLVALGLVRP